MPKNSWSQYGFLRSKDALFFPLMRKGKKPDIELHELLKQAPVILLSLDFDSSGKKHYSFWMKHYFNLRPWPIPYFKSPGDAFEKSQINITNWIKFGLSNAGL